MPSKPRRKDKAPKPGADADSGTDDKRRSLQLTAANAKLEDLQRKLERAEARASKAEERAEAAEARAQASEKSAKERLARLRDVLGE